MTALCELVSGVDSLYLSGRAALPTQLVDDLEEMRSSAQESKQAVPFAFGGYDWELRPHGLHHHRFRLDHPLLTLGLSASEHLPAIYAQLRSEGIHSPLGPAGVTSFLSSALGNEGIDAALTVSRIDLHADWQGWQLSGDERHRFVCRARDLTTYEDNFDLSGFSFGNRTSKTVCGRIYDKTKEIEGNGHDWWRTLWGSAFDTSVPVLRTEFEFARTALREMGLGDPTATLAQVDRLWAYATQEWLTYRTPSQHHSAYRWPIAPEWEQVQKASLCGGAIPMERITAGRTAGSLRRLMPALNGYVASFGALTGHDTIKRACAALPDHLHHYERVSGKAFCDRVAEKRAMRR